MLCSHSTDIISRFLLCSVFRQGKKYADKTLSSFLRCSSVLFDIFVPQCIVQRNEGATQLENIRTNGGETPLEIYQENKQISIITLTRGQNVLPKCNWLWHSKVQYNWCPSEQVCCKTHKVYCW